MAYASVAKSDLAEGGQQQYYYQQQQPQQQQQSVAERGFNGEGGASRSGCCCCCSLQTAIVLLVMNDFLNGIWSVFFLEAVEVQQLETALVEMQDVYTMSCRGYAASTEGCMELKEAIEQAEDDINMLLHLPFIYYVQGIVYILAGAVGVLAVCFKDAQCAKVYMLSWPAKFLLGLWTTVDMVRSTKKYGVTQQGHVFSILVLNAIFLLLFFKVSWLYYKRLDLKNNRSSGSSSSAGSDSGGGGGGAPLDTKVSENTMLTVNSSV